MKALTSKIIAIVLSLTLVFTMSGVAFAEVGDGAAVDTASVNTIEGKALTGKIAEKNAGKITTKAETVDELDVVTMTTTATEEPYYGTWQMQADTYALATVTAPTTGWMWFDYVVDGIGTEDGVNVYLCDTFDFDTGEFTYYEAASGGIYTGQVLEEGAGVYVTKGTVLYLYMETPYSNEYDVDVNVRAKMYSSVSNRTLYSYTDGTKYTLASGINKAGTGTSDLYFKVKPSRTGLMTVNLKVDSDSATTGTVTLYNANKVKLSNAVQYNSSKTSTKAYFGVTKGKTYYIRVQNCGDAAGYYYTNYGIKYNVTAATDRNIGTTSKALKLKKGGSGYKTLFTANNATGTDCYKIYVPSKQTVKFTINTQKIRSGNLTVKVYKNGKQVGKAGTIYPKSTSTTYTVTYGTTYGKATKGTYYIKITKGAKASGQYTVKYNK